ncbi:molybdenum cofactor guanylyltransferase [Paenibacillus filicis]|uniref:Probable molybdenum cofactor guanylyltransferase n=1 Tax=Paenibacillus gyeongsangnamensis TaxID=3388067 RepID=A0ABT4QM05_9BACL|nr:molybdenum cofactor guanylyltransferase [Paenibacillus filicis]MCZ8517761.1 molybdenum cofactor guanylyltransferase [Paenibacillus filicis]
MRAERTGSELTGVILAGGQNRRMNGRSKALLTLEGRTFLERQLRELSRICGELLLIAPDRAPFERELAPYGGRVTVLPDLHPGQGPLAGLEAALTAAGGDELWLVGCDMPYVSAEAAIALRELRQANTADAAVARVSGRVHPLHGIYHRSGLPVVQAMLGEQVSRFMLYLDRVQLSVAEEAYFTERGIGTNFVRNVNDPEDYVRLTSGS